MKILPLRLEADVADKMDEAWRAKGIKNRMEFFRGAIGHYLAHLGARDAAALFTNAGDAGRLIREGSAQRRRGGSCPTMTCNCGNRSWSSPRPASERIAAS